MSGEHEGFWTKAKRTLKGFAQGAMASLPMTLLFSGGALALSYGAHAVFGVDPLAVVGPGGAVDASKIAIRVIGGALIGSTLNGALSGYRAYNSPEEEPSAPAERGPTAGGRERGNDVAYSNGIVPSFTPPAASRGGDRGVRAT